jgi:hypothetical protein
MKFLSCNILNCPFKLTDDKIFFWAHFFRRLLFESHLQGSSPALEDVSDILPETSVTYYKSTVCSIQEERKSHLHRGGSQKSRNSPQYCFVYHHIQPFVNYRVTIIQPRKNFRRVHIPWEAHINLLKPSGYFTYHQI